MPTKCHTPNGDTRDATCALSTHQKQYSLFCRVCVCFMLSRKINTSSKSINSQSGSKLLYEPIFYTFGRMKVVAYNVSLFVFVQYGDGHCWLVAAHRHWLASFRWFFVRLPSATYCKTCKALPLHVYEVRRPVCASSMSGSMYFVLVDCTGHVHFVSLVLFSVFAISLHFLFWFVFTRIAVQWFWVEWMAAWMMIIRSLCKWT